MRIAVFGATGTIGGQLVQQALEAGHEVRAFARTPSKLNMESSRLTVVAGDVITDQLKIEEAIAGTDAVVVALGAGAKGRVRSEGTRNIVLAMRRQGVRHLVCQSTLGAGDSAALLNLKWWLLFRGPLRWAMADHEKQEQIVRESGLDWTIVRPSSFTDGPLTGDYMQGTELDKQALKLTISRADVAHFLLSQVNDPNYVSQSVSLSC